MSKRIAFLAVLLLAFLVGFFGNTAATNAQALTESNPADKAGDGPVSHAVPAAEQLAAAERWSEAARAEASPMEWAAPDAPAEAEIAPPGPSGMVSGQLPHPDAAREAQAMFPDEWRAVEAPDFGPDGTPGIFTRYGHNLYTQLWTTYPNATIGKLYFTTATGGSSYCTATVISSTVLVTAAHCLYSGGWSTNVSFVPAERFGAAPYGSFTANNFWVMPNWISTGTRNWDIGVVRLNNNSAGRPVSFYTGTMGRTYNQPYVLSLHAIGYASNLSTQYTNLCAAESYYGGSTDVIDIGCDMTYGSSGGPWIMRWGPFTAGFVDAVVSGPGTVFGTTIRGPRFSSANFVPLCNTAGC
jgi:V8-like Glu-specific endopeptidase